MFDLDFDTNCEQSMKTNKSLKCIEHKLIYHRRGRHQLEINSTCQCEKIHGLFDVSKIYKAQFSFFY